MGKLSEICHWGVTLAKCKIVYLIYPLKKWLLTPKNRHVNICTLMVHISIFWKGTAPSYLFCERVVSVVICVLYISFLTPNNYSVKFWFLLYSKGFSMNRFLVNKCDPLCEIQVRVSKSNYEVNQSLISTIHFTIISIFDMILLRQYCMVSKNLEYSAQDGLYL